VGVGLVNGKTRGGPGMNEPGVSMETLCRLENIERDKAMEKVMREHGFTEADLIYSKVDGERRLLLGKKAVKYVKAHPDTIRREFQKAADTATAKALDAALAIIKLQKIGGGKV
jgi:hypothetical protein